MWFHLRHCSLARRPARTKCRRRRPQAHITLITALAVALPSTSMAAAADDDIQKLTKAAAESAQARKFSDAVTALEAALRQARKDAPLDVRKAIAMKGRHAGLGIYETVPGNNVDDKYALSVYVEVANHAHKTLQDGLSEVQLDVVGEFFLADGTALGKQPLGLHTFRTHSPAGVTSFGVDVQLNEKAPKGEYRLTLIVTDKVSGKRGKRDLVFRIPKAKKPSAPGESR